MSLVYLYTNEDSDDGRHEIKPGVYGMPVFQSKIKAMMQKGWKRNHDEVEPKVKAKAKKAPTKNTDEKTEGRLSVDLIGGDNADEE